MRYLEALNERNLSAVQGLVCQAYVDDVTMGLTAIDDPDEETFDFSNVSCAPQGDDVMCRFVVEQLTQSVDVTGVERMREVIFNFEDGKVCGFKEQVVE